MLRALIFYFFFIGSVADASDVVIAGYFVDSELLHQLICTSEGIIEDSDLAFYRNLVRSHLMDLEWLPQIFSERADFCSLTQALLSIQKECFGIPRIRLNTLMQYSCDAFIW